MAEIETLGILQDIESLVADNLQVVSYKWLSRSYLISSDTAKRLLQEFVEKHESGLQVVYSLSGWLKNDPPGYHIRLVSGPKLPEAKQDFDGTCSIQVYSVQASIPKDPAALWNAEFVQAEELFKQPFTGDNCLRDNRFCGISNSYVKRSIDGMPASVVAPQPKSAVDAESTKKNTVCQNISVPQPQKSEMQKTSPNVGPQIPIVAKEVKKEGNGTESFYQSSKPPVNKEKVASLPANRKKAQSDKTSSSTGGSLTTLWGRVPTKPKLSGNHADVNHVNANPTVSGSEAQICAHEALQSIDSDDDDQDVNVKRTSNESSRKRRVVFDFSDDEDFEEAVSLASPEIPNGQSCLDLKQNTELLKEEAQLNNDKQLNGKLKIKEEKRSESKQSSIEEREPSYSKKNEVCALESDSKKNEVCALESDSKKNEVCALESDSKKNEFCALESDSKKNEVCALESDSKKNEVCALESDSKKNEVCPLESDSKKEDKPTDAAPASPKRRKVLRTRIDERGREVNEVVWEGEEREQKKDDACSTKNSDHNTAAETTSKRPPAAKKSAASGNSAANPAAKAGAKKAGNATGPKQGNILSFFKRV